MEHLDDLHINNISVHYILLHKSGGERGANGAPLCGRRKQRIPSFLTNQYYKGLLAKPPPLPPFFFSLFFVEKRDINYSLTLQPCILLLQLQLKVKSLNFFLFFSPQESWEFMLDCISCNVKRLLYCFLSALVIWGHIPQ